MFELVFQTFAKCNHNAFWIFFGKNTRLCLFVNSVHSQPFTWPVQKHFPSCQPMKQLYTDSNQSFMASHILFPSYLSFHQPICVVCGCMLETHRENLDGICASNESRLSAQPGTLIPMHPLKINISNQRKRGTILYIWRSGTWQLNSSLFVHSGYRIYQRFKKCPTNEHINQLSS